jgi:hypothetical protein
MNILVIWLFFGWCNKYYNEEIEYLFAITVGGEQYA